MEFLTTLFYFIVALGVLILIHEFGHFIAARMTKMRVDIFSIGMGYRLLGYNQKSGFSFGKLPDDWESDGMTDYRISLFPIGGYVKIVGMIDESFDTDFTKSAPQPWEFRSKNAFQKAFTISAGVIMNYLLAVMIFGGMVYFTGMEKYLTNEVGYVKENMLASKIGLQNGDKILSINGDNIKAWDDLVNKLVLDKLGDDKKLIVERKGQNEEISVIGDTILKAIENEVALGLTPGNTIVTISEVMPKSLAEEANIQAYDTIMTINGANIFAASQMQDILQNQKNNTVNFGIRRSSGDVSVDIALSEDGLIGVGLSDHFLGKTKILDYGLFPAISYGISETNGKISLILNQFGKMISGKVDAKKSLGGPIAIFKQAGNQAKMGASYFLTFVALLSIMLAIINIMPIPALDGGHLLFIIIEGLIRRELPFKFKMVVQQVGFFILMGLMALVFYMDMQKYIF